MPGAWCLVLVLVVLVVLVVPGVGAWCLVRDAWLLGAGEPICSWGTGTTLVAQARTNQSIFLSYQ